MKYLITFLISVCLISCSTYYERFTYTSEQGASHTVDVSHNTFLMYGKAATLNTDTQTEEFIRTVNAADIQRKPDGVDQIVAGVVRGLAK